MCTVRVSRTTSVSYRHSSQLSILVVNGGDAMRFFVVHQVCLSGNKLGGRPVEGLCDLLKSIALGLDHD